MSSQEPPLALSQQIKSIAKTLGFSDTRICGIDLGQHKAKLLDWLEKNYHGKMHYMEKYGDKRYRPENLVPGTKSIIVTRIDYLPSKNNFLEALNTGDSGYISCYATGKDYHKLIRKRLSTLAKTLEKKIGPFNHRAFADSAPVMEKPLAQNAGHGWIGKHTNLINPKAGSFFFLGALYTNLELAHDAPFTQNHCGSCSACIDVCPTKAIVAPYQLDARRCISYLTIELKESIPVEFRSAMGNRIYGCDDCQLVCPWNKFAKITTEKAFLARIQLKTPKLIDLFAWDEATFKQNTEGSAIRRIGHVRWLRNIAIALGNAPKSEVIIKALQSRLDHPSNMLKEHISWALAQHGTIPHRKCNNSRP